MMDEGLSETFQQKGRKKYLTGPGGKKKKWKSVPGLKVKIESRIPGSMDLPHTHTQS